MLDTQQTVRLVQHAAGGDQEAFAEIFNQFYTSVFSYAMWLSNDPHLSQDLAQETFIRAYKNMHRLGPPWNLRAWLFRMTRNLLVDYKSAAKPETHFNDDIAPPQGTSNTPESNVSNDEMSHPARVALQRLAPHYRAVLILREVNGLSYKEIAESLGVSIDYVKVNLHRARHQFKNAYSYQILVEDPLPPCSTLLDLLDAYQDGEVDASQIAPIEKHIKGCTSCKQRQRELVALGDIFTSVPPVVPPAASWEAVLSKYTAKKPRSRARGRFNIMQKVIGLVALAVVIGTLTLIALASDTPDAGTPADEDSPPSEASTPDDQVAAPPEESGEEVIIIDVDQPTATVQYSYDAIGPVEETPTARSEVVSVFDCKPVGDGLFEWYEAELIYENGELVDQNITGGPVTGEWQPGCPPQVEYQPGDDSPDNDGGDGSSNGSNGSTCCGSRRCGC